MKLFVTVAVNFKDGLFSAKRAWFAAAAATKKKTANASGDKKPQKKVLMSKRKSLLGSGSNTSTSRSRPSATMDKTAALTGALFHVDPARRAAHAASLSDPVQRDARETVRNAWRLHCEQERLEERKWEAAFMASKIEAMRELRALSEPWWRHACEVDYSLPPSDRRMATLTPPNPESFPFEQ